MSSKVTGDAQPDANAPTETHQTLPTEIVDNSAEAGVVTVAENTEPTAESQSAAESAESALSAAGSAPAGGPGEPMGAADDAEPATSAEPAADASADPAGSATAAAPQADAAPEEAGPGGTEDTAEPEGSAPEDSADAEDLEDPAELENPDEPTELIAMAEPLELAEPVEDFRPPRRRTHGVLIACLFVVAAVAIVGGAIAIVGSLTHGFKKPVVIHYKKSAIFSLKTGECINPNGQQAATIVSCNAPHDAEVFATFELPGSKWQGTTAVSAAASSGCSTRLTGYLNPQLAISLASTYIYPDQVAWQAGTRTVICEVRAAKGQLTGSVRGASASAS